MLGNCPIGPLDPPGKPEQDSNVRKKEAKMKFLVLYYSLYGHIHAMAQAAAAAAAGIKNTEVVVRQVPETLPQEVIEKMGAAQARKSMSDIPVATVEELGSADAVLFGTPTRFGNICGQMRQFLDATGGLWMQAPWSANRAGSLPAAPPSTAARNRPS